jgi:H+/Cl- antiporter ClcA
MTGKIIGFFREYIFILSIIVMIVGLLVTLTGSLGVWFADFTRDLLNLSEELKWFPYVLIVGLIIFGAGLYYMYIFIKKKNFVLAEIETNKRSEFIKRHSDLKDTVRYLPSKYKKMLKEKEKELKIK